MTGYRLTSAILAAALGAAPVVASAKTLTGTIEARLQVDTSCRLFTDWLSFGTVKGQSGTVDATATLRLSCGPSVAYSVAIDNGLHFNGSRRMFNGTPAHSYVPYQLYRDAARTQVWGSTAGNLATGITPLNGEVTLTVYGRVPDTKVLAREYKDTVTVTVNF